MGTKDSAWGPLSGFESEAGEDPPIRLVGPLHLRAAEVNCWHCGACITVHALIASDVVDMGLPGRAPCYVHGIHHPPPALLDAIATRTPHFRLAASRTGSRLLANHCALCGALQPDYRLYGESGECDGPFRGEPPSNDLGPVVLEGDVGLEFAEYSY